MGAQSRISNQTIEGMIRDRADGMTVTVVARKYNVSLRTVTRYVPSVQPGRSGPPPKMTNDECVAALRDYTSGTSVPVLQERYGVSESTIRSALERAETIPPDESEQQPPSPLYLEAACIGQDPKLFEYDQEEYPGQPWADWQLNIEYAMDVCMFCPVKLLCSVSATPEEREWTVRGGREPMAYLRDGLAMGVIH